MSVKKSILHHITALFHELPYATLAGRYRLWQMHLSPGSLLHVIIIFLVDSFVILGAIKTIIEIDSPALAWIIIPREGLVAQLPDHVVILKSELAFE